MNKVQLRIYCLSVILLIFSFVLIGSSIAQSSANYHVKKAVTNQGGALSQSDNHKVVDAVGQPSPVSRASSTGYVVYSGFLGTGMLIPAAFGDINDTDIPVSFKLDQNYPNPFNPSTRITFSLPKPGHVVLKVFNTLGQTVEILLDKKMSAGSHDVEFNASGLPSGVYLYRLQVGDGPGRAAQFSEVMKMVLLR